MMYLQNWLSKKQVYWLKFGLIIPIITTLILLTSPVQALQVQVKPDHPRLGDTLSVILQGSAEQAENPTVSIQQQTYSAFPIGGNRYRAFIPTTPLDKPRNLQIQISEHGEVKTVTVPLKSRDFPIQHINLPPGKSGLKATELELSRVKAFKQLVTPEKYWKGTFLAPNRGRRSTGYGVRRYYNGIFAKDYYHRGVDYAGGYGSPILAPAAGKVALVGREKQGFRVHGNVIGIDHGQGITSIFMHLSRIDVQEGDFVQAGQTIGAIGSTGAATGPHLHWGLYVNGLSVDPASWLSMGWD